MTSLLLDGLAHWAWTYEPDWGAGVRCTFRMESARRRGLTGREEREPLAETLRCELEAEYLLGAREAAEARNALRHLGDGRVRMPWWPALQDIQWWSKWYMAFDRGAGPGALEHLWWTDDAEDLAGRGNIVPTLLGYLDGSPTFELLHPDLVLARLKWMESSGAAEALQISPQTWQEGPQLGSRTAYQFPLTPTWTGSAEAGAVRVEVAREQLGFGREAATEAYPQTGAREPVFGFAMDGSEAAALVRFYAERKGVVEPFWLPCYLEECRLAADVEAASTEIEVTDARALGDHRHLLIAYGASQILRKIVGIDGNVLTLNEAVGPLVAGETFLSALALVRFASGQLTVTWTGPDRAEAEIKFVEVPPEYGTPLGEEHGSTLGALAGRCYLYMLRHGTETWRWTSYESDLTYQGQTYEARPVEHGELVDGALWDRDQATVRCRWWSGNPLGMLLDRTATERLELVIAEARAGNPVTNYEVLFRGWLESVQFRGAFVEASARGQGTLFERKVPRTLMQVTDNYALFDAGNRLVKADWTFTGRLIAVSGRTLTFDTLSWPGGALPSIGAEYFALGYVERPPGASFERVMVASSAALVGGELTVTLAHDLGRGVPTTPEAGWKLVPGYDGLLATATGKFNNKVNFGGFPALPATNPTLSVYKQTTAPDSKK